MPIELGSFSLGAIVGGIVVGVCNHFLAKSRIEEDRSIKEFNEAARKYREVFSVLITQLNTRSPGTSPNASKIIGQAYPEHLAATDEFRNHLSAKDIPTFSKAWEEYDAGRKNGEYSDRYKDSKSTNPVLPHMVALQRIEKLIEFAKPR